MVNGYEKLSSNSTKCSFCENNKIHNVVEQNDHKLRFSIKSYYECTVVNFRFIVKDRETFFSSAQRSQIVWQLLMRTSYDDDDSDKVGIVRLLSNGVFKAAYPLHDGAAVVKDDTSQLSSRKVILEQNHKLFKSVPS